jgi:hypothetical protein
VRKSLKAEAQGFTLLVFCWIQNQQQWQNRGTIDYHIGYRLNLENWSERSFHQSFCGQRLELSMCSECVFAEFNLIQMEVSRVMEVTPNHSLRMGQWKPPDLKHQNSETGGLFLGARFQRHNRRSGNAEPPLCHGNEEETPEVWVFTLADHFDIKGWQYTINICLMMVNILLIYG